MKLAMFLIAACLGLSACVSAKPVFDRDGRQVFEVRCNGFARTIGDCYKEASKQCHGQFDEMATDTGGFNKRSLLFTCRG